MKPAILCLAANVLLAQPTPAPDSQTAPREKARQLLDASIETLAAASPAIQVAALLEIIQLYPEFDKAKTLELLDQAFAAAGAVPPETSRNVTPANLQTRVVFAAAELDTNKAIEMLSGLPVDRRGGAAERIALALLARKEAERAIRVVEENTGQGYPPLRAIDALLSSLPPDHPQRASLFANAFLNLQLDSDTGFQNLIARHWRTLPRPTVEAALNRLLSAILDRKDEGTASTIAIGASKGTANFEDYKDYQLFDVIGILEDFDPKRAAAILEQRPLLREVHQRFPEGRRSMMADEKEGLSISTQSSGKSERRNAEAEANVRLGAISEAKSREIAALAGKDIQLAVSRIKEIPLEFMQVQTLVRIATFAAEKDPATARSVIGQAITLLKEIKEPQLNGQAWAAIADAAHRAKDDELARQAIDRGLSACSEMYKLDTNADSPNQAERERWPSVQHFRNILYRAAQIDGVTADAFLVRMNDPDLVLMGRVEIARSLLGKPRGGMSTSVSRRGRR